jgi:hypothetical protein
MVGLRHGPAWVQERHPLMIYIATAAAAVGLSSPARITCGDLNGGEAAARLCGQRTNLAAMTLAERRADEWAPRSLGPSGRCAEREQRA